MTYPYAETTYPVLPGNEVEFILPVERYRTSQNIDDTYA